MMGIQSAIVWCTPKFFPFAKLIRESHRCCSKECSLHSHTLRRMAGEDCLSTRALESVMVGESHWQPLESPAMNKNGLIFFFVNSYFPSSTVAINANYVLKIQQVLDFSQHIGESYQASPQIISSHIQEEHLVLYIFVCVIKTWNAATYRQLFQKKKKNKAVKDH